MLRRSLFAMSKKMAPAAFFSALQKHEYNSFYGVPDSLLKDLCAYITDHVPPQNHVITSNEGSAVAMAAGYHLATGRVPVVYMQNSGFGNTVNPLLSLTHREVYQIPMLMIVGWRGDPEGKKDEPQHVAQGRLMEACFAACEVPFAVLEAGEHIDTTLEQHLATARTHFEKSGTPFALLVKRDTFSSHKLQNKREPPLPLPMGREEAISVILGLIGHKDIVVSTTGMPSREVYEIRAKAKAGHHRDFLTVGCMGHASSIAAGIALSKADRNVVCIDGDGAAIMHLGTMAVNGGLAAVNSIRGEPSGANLLANLKHIVVNNGAHDSVGGQPTAAHDVSLTGVAKACGYRVIRDEPVVDAGDLVHAVTELNQTPGPCFLEVLVKKGNRADLGRPTTTPKQNKEAFMEFVRGDAADK